MLCVCILGAEDSTEDVMVAKRKKSKKPKKARKSKPKTKKRRKKKRKRDPNAPKRPKSAYLFFCIDARVKVKEDTPNMKMNEIMKVLLCCGSLGVSQFFNNNN